jgi:hypothetical protein
VAEERYMALKEPIAPAVWSIDPESGKTDESLTENMLREMEEQYLELTNSLNIPD